MFPELKDIIRKPKLHEFANPVDLWNDPHISGQMLKLHLDPQGEPASRSRAFLDKSIAWIRERFSLQPSTRILDLGCGPGLYTTAFAEAGCAVTGVDVSENSISYAQETAAGKGLAVDYINGNYLDAVFDGPFDLITMIYNDYCVLSPDQRTILLGKIRAALAKGGIFLFDVFSIGYFDSEEERQNFSHCKEGGFWAPDEHFLFECIFKFPEGPTVLQKHTVITAERQLTIHNYLHCFTRETIARELSENGFAVQEYYADVAGGRYGDGGMDFALVASPA